MKSKLDKIYTEVVTLLLEEKVFIQADQGIRELILRRLEPICEIHDWPSCALADLKACREWKEEEQRQGK